MTGSTAEPPALSIVVPVYNGADTVPALVEALQGCGIDGGIEIVLVNDGSDDDSARVCEELVGGASVPVTFIDLARNFGEHNAVLAGLRFARGNHAITMDDDLQQPASEVARLLEHARANDLDAVFGAFIERRYAKWRNLGSRIAQVTTDKFVGKPRGLVLSSFRCLSRQLVDELVSYRGPYPYIDGMILKLTRNVGNLGVEHLERPSGKSNYTLTKLIRLWSHILFNFSIRPLRISMITGLWLFAAAGLGAIYVIYDRMTENYDAPGWASIMVLLLVFSGLQFIFLGLIGEYVGRIYMSIGGLPQSSVRRVIRPDDGGDA